MGNTLSRPGTEPEITEGEKAILTERLKTVEEDAKDARDAYEVLAELRQRLRKKSPAPR